MIALSAFGANTSMEGTVKRGIGIPPRIRKCPGTVSVEADLEGVEQPLARPVGSWV